MKAGFPRLSPPHANSVWGVFLTYSLLSGIIPMPIDDKLGLFERLLEKP